ncbi:MAG: hypothetical protein ACLFRU_09560 [Paracoccaceae bacterium]
MQIRFSPVRRDAILTLERAGDTLILNGDPIDFSGIPDGATMPRDTIDSPWFAGPVARIDGELHLMLVLPHGARAPHDTLFPEPMTVVADGPIPVPPCEIGAAAL